MYLLDLNSDMAESFGAYHIGLDDELLTVVTSANIACGFHAGDPATMRKAVKTPIKNGVGIGAHPGFPDLVGFGRRNLDVSPEEAYDMVVYQIGALYGFVQAGEEVGLRTASEVFADKTYQEDGTLNPRRKKDAMIPDADTAVAQVIRMVKEGKVRSQQGTDVSIQADTVCIHGDGAHAVQFAQSLRRALTDSGITVESVEKRFT